MLCELFLPGRVCLQFSGWCRLDCCLHVRQGGETAIGMKADHSFKTSIQTRPPKSQDRSLWSSSKGVSSRSTKFSCITDLWAYWGITRSDERRVGKECVSKCSSQWWQDNKKKTVT